MFAAPFDYYRPTTVAEALQLLRSVEGARLLAGGHSLLPAMKLRLAQPAALVDIGRVAELSGITAVKDGLRIGAMTTHAAVAASDVVRKACPVLADVAGHIGDQQVRNRGTIGGSLAHADPGADYPTLMVLLDAKITTSEREIAARDFFVDLLTTAMGPGEMLLSVTVPATTGKAVYLKHRHPASSFAVVGVAATAGRIAVGGVTPVPVLVTDGNVAGALKNPIGDSYASGEFRVHLATVMAKRAMADVGKG